MTQGMGEWVLGGALAPTGNSDPDLQLATEFFSAHHFSFSALKIPVKTLENVVT